MEFAISAHPDGMRTFTQAIKTGILRESLFNETLCIPEGTYVTEGIAMLSSHGEIVMKILSKRQLKELVLYSPQHVARLEKAGQFPLRVNLGPNRVGWVESEVLDWLNERLQRREA